ncbi:hypothetical protein KFK09_004759 [Dendrobium nobile]|uniref:Uncharacterized protein n=1 Tax=Dendrobium nobile TaxID=94219 RepID=A0A8T3BTV4_DENNO|nr:hypothetical protein KFK09_004759 [Dendrobium nobile]
MEPIIATISILSIGEKQMLPNNSNRIHDPSFSSNPCDSHKALSQMVITDVNTNYTNPFQSMIVNEQVNDIIIERDEPLLSENDLSQ